MDKPSNAFTTDEAAKIIIAGIENGAIHFPFLQAFDQEKLQEFAKGDFRKRNLSGVSREKAINEATDNRFASQLGFLARMDALYLLSLRQMLITGLTEEEAKRIIDMAASRFM
jgi:hypothetical protein|nr:MAG TPA: hypothetical protein [Caudoviricetes sp.]